MPFVKLQLGNLFDEPTDLVVLPCSTGGTITNFVSNHLREYDIPAPRAGMELGDVDIMPLVGAENVAQFAAFAASVKQMSSQIRAIKQIGKKLGSATQEFGAVRRVSAPLLGASAGGLRSEDVVEALGLGFKSTAAEDAVLTIFVLHENVIERLRGKQELRARSDSRSNAKTGKSESQRVPIRVFISYSGTSSLHKSWVADLATHLRSNGLDARLDQWHLRAGMDLPQWMANELQLAERVIVISDSRYTERADGRIGGVGWETMLIQGDMANRTADDYRYVVIVREDHFQSGVPIYLKTKNCIHWRPGDNESTLRTELLKELYNVEKAPPIGVPPVFLFN